MQAGRVSQRVFQFQSSAARAHLRIRVAVVAITLALWLLPFGGNVPFAVLPTSAQTSSPPSAGHVLAVIGRQIGFVDLAAPRPRMLTTFSAPSFAMDVAALSSTSLAVFSVSEPFGGQGQSTLGGDLLRLDLSAPGSQPVPFLMRNDANEWLGAPTWLPDGSGVLFQRESVQAGSDPNAGPFAAVRYPSRIELADASGGARRVVIDYGHHPSPSPDGSEIAFVRLSSDGSMLMAHDMASGDERTLVKAGTMPDIAYPRYSADGSRIAFVATGALANDSLNAAEPSMTWPLADMFGPQAAEAHGLPWNVWVVNRDGSGLRELAEVTEDDASLAWSPDDSQIFVYGSSGARMVDVATGNAEALPYIAGFGAISWLP